MSKPKDSSFTIEAPPSGNAITTIDAESQPEPTGRHRHRGAFKGRQLEYTQADRDMVRLLAFYGVYPEFICKHVINRVTGLPIGETALKRHFSKELEAGTNEGDAMVARSLFQHMEGRAAEYMRDKNGDLLFDPHGRPIVARSEIKPTVVAPIFMAKTRRGLAMREAVVIEHTTSVDGELASALQPLTLDEKRQLRSILDQREELLRAQRRKDHQQLSAGYKPQRKHR